MTDPESKRTSGKNRIMDQDDDIPLIVTGRKGRTRQVASATLLASGAEPETVIRRTRFDESGGVVERFVQRIRRVAR